MFRLIAMQYNGNGTLGGSSHCQGFVIIIIISPTACSGRWLQCTANIHLNYSIKYLKCW